MEKSNQVQQDNSNLSIYERVRCVPKEAKKEIEAGRLKGKHDINPMFSSKGRDWGTAVAFTASQTDTAEVISEKIRSKYDITDKVRNSSLLESSTRTPGPTRTESSIRISKSS